MLGVRVFVTHENPEIEYSPKPLVMVEASPWELVRVMVTPGTATPKGPEVVHCPTAPLIKMIGQGVGVGVGEAQVQVPFISKTMCMFGKPMDAVVSGDCIPQAGALK